MARARLHVPAEVLRDQAHAVCVHLGHPEAIAAFAAVGLDAVALADEVRSAADEAADAVRALTRARDDLTLIAGRRAAWKESFARWTRGVRAVLASRPDLTRGPAEELRRRLPSRPAKNFEPSRQALELSLASLTVHAEALQVQTWYQNPIDEGERLLAGARSLVALTDAAERARVDGSARVGAARTRLQTCLRAALASWGARRGHRSPPRAAPSRRGRLPPGGGAPPEGAGGP